MAVPPGGTGVSATRGRHDGAGSIGDDDGPAGGHLVANAHLPEVRAGRGDVPRGDLDTATITTDHRAVVGAGPDTVERNGEHGAGVAVASRGDQRVTALVTGRREEMPAAIVWSDELFAVTTATRWTDRSPVSVAVRTLVRASSIKGQMCAPGGVPFQEIVDTMSQDIVDTS